MPDLSIAETAQRVTDTAISHLALFRSVVIRAHAGAGKTGGRSSGTVRVAAKAVSSGLRVLLLVAQNDQLAETTLRLCRDWPAMTTTLIPATRSWPQAMPGWITDPRQRPANLLVADPDSGDGQARNRLQDQPGLFVMTLAKSGYLRGRWSDTRTGGFIPVDAFDVIIVDEAWMVPASEWRHLQHLGRTFLLIGDPGQIMPWAPESEYYPGMQGSPIEPLPELLLRERPGTVELELPVTRRNPSHTTDITGRLPAYAGSPTRPMFTAAEVPIVPTVARISREPADPAIDAMLGAGMSLYRLPGGLAGQDDRLTAAGCASAAARLLGLGPQLGHPSGTRPLTGDDIAIIVTHHDQRAAVLRELAAAGLAGPAQPRVATFNTIQGATVAVTIMWHPLSGREDVSSFHADAGRLTVGLTRHTHGCLLVSRDGVGDQVAAAPVTGDLEGDAVDLRYAGLRAHELVWSHLTR
ncbi:hypothetical protein [Actinoplanes sp. NPDC020271]|uniref:hypothetical protein n=1 Tax=Actinoplanes sp. NPDC020271 TaxID=3363896 RepID=UPI0037A438B9